jgi:sec-independent protein translocase protein TatC
MVEDDSQKSQTQPESEPEQEQEATRMSLGEHLDELRRRVIYSLLGLATAMAAALVFGREIVWVLKHPYDAALQQVEPGADAGLAVLSAGAGFDAYMRISFYCGLVIACPWILYQLWLFISAGLYPNERRYVSRSVPFSVLLFLGGTAFFYFFVAVPAIRFLLWFDRYMGLKPMVTLQSHVGFMTDMFLAFGIAFQTPLAILILAKVGLVDMKMLNRYRRMAIFAILVFSAVFAPPDALSMLAMAVPMWLLYEFGVLLAFLAIRKRQREKAQEAAEDQSMD